jgi:hypothetical protein
MIGLLCACTAFTRTSVNRAHPLQISGRMSLSQHMSLFH